MFSPDIIFDAVTTAGVGQPIYVKDAKHVKVTVATSGVGAGESFNINFKGSCEEAKPDFSTAKSITNLWDYLEAIKQADGTPIDGVAGDLFTGANDVRIYELNVNGLTWFTLDLNTLTGSVVVSAKAQKYGDNARP